MKKILICLIVLAVMNVYAYDKETLRFNMELINKARVAVAGYVADKDDNFTQNFEKVLVENGYISPRDLCFLQMGCFTLMPVKEHKTHFTIEKKGRDLALVFERKDNFFGCIVDAIMDDGDPSAGVVKGITKHNFKSTSTSKDCYGNAPQIQYLMLVF